MRVFFSLVPCFLLTLPACRSAAAEREFEGVKPIPPPGISISESDRAELERGAAELGREIESLRVELSGKAALLELLPDAQIYHKAVDWALRYDEFYQSNEVATARQLLTEGMARVKALREGQMPWASATGLVVRGYVSKIDGSVQPYGLVVPPSYRPETAHKFRLDVWCHGRGEKLSELNSSVTGRKIAASSRRPTPSSCIPMAAIATPTIRRRDRSVRGAGRRQEALSDRRKSPRDARLLDGRRGLLAVCRPLSGPVGRGRARGRLLGDGGLPQVFQKEP